MDLIDMAHQEGEGLEGCGAEEKDIMVLGMNTATPYHLRMLLAQGRFQVPEEISLSHQGCGGSIPMR